MARKLITTDTEYKQFYAYLKYLCNGPYYRENQRLATEADLSQGFLSNVLKGAARAGLESRVKIARAVGIPYDEFLEMGQHVLDHGDIPSEEDSTTRLTPLLTKKVQSYLDVPLFPMRVSAGWGQVVDGGDIVRWIKFEEQYLRSLGQVKQIVGMILVGDSMEPLLKDGSLVLVDQSQSEHLYPGKPYLVRVGDMLFAKFIEVDGDDGDVILRSYNPNYKDIRVNPESDNFQILGRIVYGAQKY